MHGIILASEQLSFDFLFFAHYSILNQPLGFPIHCRDPEKQHNVLIDLMSSCLTS